MLNRIIEGLISEVLGGLILAAILGFFGLLITKIGISWFYTWTNIIGILFAILFLTGIIIFIKSINGELETTSFQNKLEYYFVKTILLLIGLSGCTYFWTISDPIRWVRLITCISLSLLISFPLYLFIKWFSSFISGNISNWLPQFITLLLFIGFIFLIIFQNNLIKFCCISTPIPTNTSSPPPHTITPPPSNTETAISPTSTDTPSTTSTKSISTYTPTPKESITELLQFLRDEIEKADPKDEGRLSSVRSNKHTFDYQFGTNHHNFTVGLWDVWKPISAVWDISDISETTKGIKNNQTYWVAYLKVEWHGTGTKHSNQTWKMCFLEENGIWLIDSVISTPETSCPGYVNRY